MTAVWVAGQEPSSSPTPPETAQYTKRTDVEQIAYGVHCFHNPTNKFYVMEVHYSADPKKRSFAWRQNESRGITPSDWAREYELSWVVRTGRPVYNNLFDRSRHMFGPRTPRGDVELPTDARLVIGVDTGPTATRMGASFNLFQPSGVKWTIDEVFCEQASVAEFMDQVTAKLEIWLSLSLGEPLVVVDPTAIETDSKIELRACVDIMRLYVPYPIVSGERSWTTRRKMVEDELTVHRGPLPRYNVHERCTMHVDGFEGGYQLKALSASMGGGFSATPVKNAYSEIHDSLQYAVSKREGLFTKIETFDTTKRIASYGIGGRHTPRGMIAQGWTSA